ncbi:class I SAM-dependent methyltransferase [Glaciihabitans sp. dw_435]|uniref:class I SAM-dependent methyltransferase n=1 Tax=Glaciihabitans sp. dw_435 TaxID=2720081 RepID=UPI001BD69700|nr:class I SAM-dependent methyltransferase [Glaciihabitans sp. dw_435]
MPDYDQPSESDHPLDLRRWPDIEADNLFAVDAADRLILDEAAPFLAGTAPGQVVVIGDNYGALTLGAIDRFGLADIRVHQDRALGEQALDANADALGISGYRHLSLDAELLSDATVVLLRLPRSLDALDEIASLIAGFADASTVVIAGGRIKHLTPAMNDVLLRHFGRLDVTHARQKARVLIARESRGAGASISSYPHREFHADLGIWICAHGGAFAGTKVDIGTRFLLEVTDQMKVDATSAIDLGSGTGLIAAALALRRPEITVIATDQSAVAVASTRATAEANGVSDRVTAVRDIGLSNQPDASADLILLNPPFHIEGTVHLGEALRLFEDAGRVLRPGGELWTVFNSNLGYRSTLSRVVGPTRQVARNTKFSVMVSTRE